MDCSCARLARRAPGLQDRGKRRAASSGEAPKRLKYSRMAVSNRGPFT